jgi:putative Ca2+/H+ antiporter (TMEM165/GDT1 family)
MLVAIDLNVIRRARRMSEIISIFVSVFLAELGDKTQLATVLFASDKALSPTAVFIAAAAALVTSTAVAVFVGASAQPFLARIPLKLIAGGLFVAIGVWNIVDHFRASA